MNYAAYSVAPAALLTDRRVSHAAYRLYGHISGMAEGDGCCRASNKRLSQVAEMGASTVKRHLKELEELGYIATELVCQEGTSQVVERRIYLIVDGRRWQASPPPEGEMEPQGESEPTPGPEMAPPQPKNEPDVASSKNNKLYNTTPLPPKDSQGETGPRCPLKEIQAAYHATCTGLPGILKISGARMRAVQARWREHPSLEEFQAYFQRVAQSAFLNGGGARGWRADFDWIMGEAHWTRIMEGRYDDAATGLAPAPAPVQARPPRGHYETIGGEERWVADD